MRYHILGLLSCLCLTHCVYYGDLHGQSRKLNPSQLEQSHFYQPGVGPKLFGVWTRFHDPELNRLICIALADSPTMYAAEARVRQASSIASGAVAGLWPTLDLSGNIQRQRFSQRGLVPPPFNGQTFDIMTLGFDFNYEFDFWGKNRETLKAAIGEERAATNAAKQTQLILAAAIADTYFRLQGALAQEKIVEKNQKLNERILRIAQNRNRHGLLSQIPVKTIEQNLQAVVLILQDYHQQEMLARNQLAVLIGKNPLTTNLITTPLEFKFYRVNLPHSLPANLIANRPDLRAAKYRAEAAAHRINVAKARFYPDINLMALFSYQNVGLQQIFNRDNQNNAITAAVDLPIFDAGSRRAQLKRQYAEYDVAVNDYNQTLLNAVREVADQLALLKSLDNQLNTHNLAVSASQKQLELYRKQFNHGIVDTAQLLESELALLQQQTIQLNLQTRHLQAVVAMLTALGGQDTKTKGSL